MYYKNTYFCQYHKGQNIINIFSQMRTNGETGSNFLLAKIKLYGTLIIYSTSIQKVVIFPTTVYESPLSSSVKNSTNVSMVSSTSNDHWCMIHGVVMPTISFIHLSAVYMITCMNIYTAYLYSTLFTGLVLLLLW